MVILKKKNNSKELSHAIFFFVGWMYYLLLPIFTAYSGLFEGIDAIAAWSKYISVDINYFLISYAALMPVFYILGSFSNRIRVRFNPSLQSLHMLSWIVIPIYSFLLVFYTLAARDFIFTGYSDGMDASLAGPIATLEMAILFHYLTCKSSGNKQLSLFPGFLLTVTSIVLLGMGGRIYVISALVSVFFYIWNWGGFSVAKRRQILMLFTLTPFGLVAIGMWRVGDLNFNVVGFYLFAESLFTSISAFTLMQSSSWHWLNFPIDFIVSILNVIPIFFWPNKSLVLASLLDVNLDIESPFGAYNVIASSITNFGFIGGLCFIGLVGFIMGLAKKSSDSPLIKAFYCFLVGLLPFIFFRDPYMVQVKLVVMAFFLVAGYRLFSLLRPFNYRI
jgi:hypothetical protein